MFASYAKLRMSAIQQKPEKNVHDEQKYTKKLSEVG